ncbi:MAG TPA: M1 family aminopeptidase [Polyangiaceae bacterium]|nr:M1 family aminopeptidase [Polyangiaceae bacterium]
MERACCKGAADSFTLPDAAKHYSPDLRLEPVHLDLQVAIDIEQRRLDVRLSVAVRARQAGARSLRLDGIDLRNLTVTWLEPGSSSYDGKTIVLTWATPFALAEVRRVELAYRVLSPVTGVLFSSPDLEQPDAPTFAVTDHETERARYWLASVDHPSVRPTLDIRLRADARLTLLANGEAQPEELHADGTKTAHFVQSVGCPSYLVCFAIGDFVRWDGGEFQGVPIAAFAPKPFTPEHLERSFGRTREMLEFLTRRLGVAYPFAKYFQFAAEGIGGAMENISLVSWDDRFLLDEVLEREERWLVDLVNVHEMAHSWFGDSVICRDFAHSWLKEGWATYLESCWFEASEGPDELQVDLWNHADAYFNEVDEKYRRPIVTRKYDSSFDLFDQHLYPGAACRIHMLRKLLGEDAFWAGVRDYLIGHAGRVAETEDFRRALEERSGLSLERFFEQWFHRAGFPDLLVTFRHDAERAEGVFEIVQKQADEKTGEGAFHFDLELAWGNVDAPALERTSVRVSGRRTLAVLSMAAAPELLRVDPDGLVLHRLDFDPGSERLLRQLAAPDARGRIQAGVLLVRHAGRTGAAALGAAFEAEPSWGVRAKWSEALGKAASEAALEALLAIAEEHEHPRSLGAVFRALGKYRDPRVTDVLIARLDRGLPYRATEAAYEALGAQRAAAPFDRLLAAAQQPGFGGFAQSGALRALGATRRAAALEPLMRALSPGEVPRRVRHAAADGLGALAATLADRPRERAIEALSDALRDPLPKVQLSAARALGHARAREAEPALEALAQRLARQDQVKVLRVLRGLRNLDQEPARSQELDQLQERVRKLALEVDELKARAEGKPAPPS